MVIAESSADPGVAALVSAAWLATSLFFWKSGIWERSSTERSRILRSRGDIDDIRLQRTVGRALLFISAAVFLVSLGVWIVQ